MSTLRSRLYLQLDAAIWPSRGLSPLNRAILIVVLLSVLTAVLESEPTIETLLPAGFATLNSVFAILLLIEYCVRV